MTIIRVDVPDWDGWLSEDETLFWHKTPKPKRRMIAALTKERREELRWERLYAYVRRTVLRPEVKLEGPNDA